MSVACVFARTLDSFHSEETNQIKKKEKGKKERRKKEEKSL